MENSSYALRAGLFTLALLLAAIAAAFWFNRDRTEQVVYELATQRSIPGLKEQAAVRYRGLDVGRVEDIAFDPQVPGQILVRIGVQPDTPVTRSTYGMLGYQGVTGIAYVELNDDGRDPVRVQSSPNKPARIELRPSLLNTLEERGLVILGQVEQISRRLNALLNDENQQKVQQAITSMNTTMQAFERIPAQLQPTLSQMPALTAQARQAMASIDRAATELGRFGAQLQAANPVERFGRSADEITATADRIERDILPLTQEFRSTMRLFNRTLENINDRPQSLLFGSGAVAPGPGESSR